MRIELSEHESEIDYDFTSISLSHTNMSIRSFDSSIRNYGKTNSECATKPHASSILNMLKGRTLYNVRVVYTSMNAIAKGLKYYIFMHVPTYTFVDLRVGHLLQ